MAKRRYDWLSEDDIKAFQSRLRHSMGGLSEAKFAEKANISQAGLNRLLNGGMPAMDILIAIAMAADVGIEWLALGPQQRTAESTALEQAQSEFGLDDADIVRLPRYDVKASAGHGLIAVNEMQIGEVAFGRTYLRKLGGNPDYCYAIEASGDSMWPTISDGDLLVADSSQNEPEDGRIFHFNAGNRVLVKRARWQMDGKLRLTSDNAAAGYPDEVFGADEASDVRAGGRVIFIGGLPMPVRAS